MSIPSSAQNIIVPFIGDPNSSELYDFTYNILTLVPPHNLGEVFMVLQKNYDDGYQVSIGGSEGMVIVGLAQAITLDAADTYSLSVLNYCLKTFVGISDINSPDIISAYAAKVLEIELRTFSGTTVDEVRADFFNSELIISDPTTRVLLAKYVAARVAAARLYFTDVAYSAIADMDWAAIDANLEVIRSEIDQEIIDNTDPPELDQTGIGNLQLFISLSMYPIIEEANGVDVVINDQMMISFITRESGGNYDRVNLDAFYRVFSTVNPSLYKIEPWSLTDLMNKMSTYGVFNLISYAGEISDFAKRRLRNIDTVQQSAASFLVESADLPWLMKLDEVSKIIRKDQVFFGSLVYYFPSLVTFLLDAIAVTGDYSNGGRGGGTEDEVNDPNAMIDSLEKAFGIGENGQQVFELAFKLTNTAKRIKDVIASSPFRPNTPPENPDIFHLRLGASNFYVPPISINVNSSFKAGSLMAGALRQKNSPKFNSGYRETTVRMRLFFPNYEEIWGISIDDASNIRLTEDFKIDFRGDYNNDGIIDGDPDRKIDKFLSSLRGLVAAFKYSPFLPIKNHYLNSVHGITAVGLIGMNISTIPNFPFALAVDLEMVNFNYKPLLPMITDFNQAIHWGRYRQYMGKAAGQMNKYVNEEFLLKTTDVKEADNSATEIFTDTSVNSAPAPGAVVITSAGEYRPIEALEANEVYTVAPEQDLDLFKTNVIDDWRNGNHLTIFAPAESQTKLFLPSMSSFRTDEEKLMTDLGRSTWESLLFDIGIDINESASYGLTLSETVDISRENAYSKSNKKVILDSIDILTAGVNTSTHADSVYQYLVTNFIIENSKYFDKNKDEDVAKANWLKNKNDSSRPYTTTLGYIFQGKYINEVSLNSIKDGFINIAESPIEFLDYTVNNIIADQEYRNGVTPDRTKVKEEVQKAFNVAIYERFFQSGPIQSLMEAARARTGAYQFNEWEVPMLRVDLDPESVIINGVTVSMGNNIVKLQVQMQDEPTYQHIGGRDSYINISMTVIGEKELIKLKSIFDHISGLARLEHASGVIGFLGIKNIITALSGIKYVMPLNYSVSTRPNFPHVYDVELSLVDFDIFQQKREEISSKQQRDIIDHFNSKRNPFLRIKQLWGSFNAYPDFPLELKNNSGETVGCLDPDFYFRSFEMFDNDVINHVDHQRRTIEEFSFNFPDTVEPQNELAILGEVLRIMRSYSEYITLTTTAGADARINLLTELTDLIEYYNVSKQYLINVVLNTVKRGVTNVTADQSNKFLVDFIAFGEGATENNQYEFIEVQPAPYQVGSISPSDVTLLAVIESALEGRYSLENDKDQQGNIIVSFHPDEVDFHKQIFAIPAADQDDINQNRIPSILMTAVGTHYGYIDKVSGRFYLTAGGQTVPKTYNSAESAGEFGFSTNFIDDTQTPDRGTTNSMTGAYGVVPLSEYQKPYNSNPAAHWEKMLVDTRYRDLSGRMIRAFPTYMLWLIDEGGYFAGVKLFDNFYGLQSIIDFSVVSSEDLLGDTLIFRVSNLYSKLTKKESTNLFSTNQDDYVPDTLSLPEGLGGIIDRTLNTARNILSGMRNEYVVDIQNIRLKPGVRVHLRAGYGSNPNSLQTIFNGVITNVEQGEIVTVTAQSDAIELGAVVNSTNKKGDSGKIDGGIDTGMYLSEPRDLMVRLLSMGSSRTREAIAHATRGTVFSENKFGIRHFGNVLYEPLNPSEKAKNDAIRENVSAAYKLVGGDKSQGVFGFSMNIRGSTLDTMGQLWANFSAQIDLEIFKRNIYPGNGLGIAQFLGGDIDDGWSTVASLTSDEQYFDRQDGYLGRLTDLTYNKVLTEYQKNDTNAKETIEQLTAQNALVQSGRSTMVKNGLSGIGMILGGITATAMPVTGVAIAGASLLGVLSGRGGENVFRAMGLISPNADDDLSGFDEVSFRAQTYMRSVWDLFQICARLLPNYIVAVRPFEDRSTVFYGKPHWLYTSGVVPVTTGFPGEEKARELGITSGPKPLEPDQLLQQILNTINKDSNPLSDYSAYFQAFEPNESFATVAQQISTSTGIYAPSSILAGKVINFYSPKAQEYRLPSQGNAIVAKLPVSKGYVAIGPHLPIIPPEALDGKNATGETPTEGFMSIQQGIHRQINNLPPRFSFPYFTVTEKLQLELAGSIPISPTFYEFTEYNDWRSITYNSLNTLGALEYTFFNDTKFSLMPSAAEGNVLTLDTPIDFSNLIQQAKESVVLNDLYVKMPLPSIFQAENSVNTTAVVNGDYSFEYQEGNYGELTYKEWGAPSTPEDEQFYIAMRWPYNVEPKIAGATELDNSTLEAFKSKYGFTELYGEVKDYKARKVLVYSPSTRRAVVCRPAYFLWGEGELSDADDTDIANGQQPLIAARVSPDAAFFLGMLTYSEVEAADLLDYGATSDHIIGIMDIDQTIATVGTAQSAPYWLNVSKLFTVASSGYRFAPVARECYFSFVPDNVPLGVLSITETPVSSFKKVDSSGAIVENEDEFIVGFGNFSSTGDELMVQEYDYGSAGSEVRDPNLVLYEYKLYNTELINITDALIYGGNPVNLEESSGYFNAVIDANYDLLTAEKLNEFKKSDIESGTDGSSRTRFLKVWDPVELTSIQARQYFDENYDPNVSVIAGNGRTLDEAQQIWDQFRAEYHTYDSVKRIFADVYGLNPDGELPFPEIFKNILAGTDENNFNGIQKFKKSDDPNALDEFAILLGSDYVSPNADSPGAGSSSQATIEAIEFMRENWIDQPLDDGGLVEFYNHNLKTSFARIGKAFFDDQSIGFLNFFFESDSETTTTSMQTKLLENIQTPKQLFLLMVGIFRQRMWEDPYARAWLVLKPDKKAGWTGASGWSLKPVDQIFRAFIDPYQDYAKPSKKSKFLQLLVATRGEGNNSSTHFSEAIEDVTEFVGRTVGPIFSAVGDALSGLMNMFKLSMQQLGYALSEVGNFKRQANILNKALNDSIYYSLGRPGTLLRAVDNPFTREYGEPVIEIREPFQRLHYISSFSHILSNQIQENLNGVSTVITAVSDGKYPVSVALDKGAPAERQVEKTVETGIIFDNITGSGFTGFLHPLMHPLETFRGIAKNAQGTPDELSARRIALAHLKESIKDIYGGELIVLGNTDIRPHDLVYLSDVYERMYGIFEVEQVVHHFTPELGFITSITPNALVTVNDPARWFMTSWMQSWMHVQNIRNDSRIYIDNIRNANSGLSLGGNISVDRLSEILSTQLVGGFQFTHGSTALVKDVMASEAAKAMPGANQAMLAEEANKGDGVGGVPTFAMMASAVPLIGPLVWKGWKWVRDNVLDQHGCYVQYLNKNGQPMDAGLSFNQGMVVGQHHSTALLPGLLGVRAKTRTPEGNSFIRTDDLFKSLGWNETDISEITRYISYESSLVHARVLKLSGLGPDKAGFDWQFRVLCKVVNVRDGDTIDVQDIISGATFAIRFDGIGASETNVMNATLDYPSNQSPTTLSILDISTPGGIAKMYVKNAIENKIIVARINKTRTETQVSDDTRMLEEQYEAGSTWNNIQNYQLDIFGRSSDGTIDQGNTSPRALGTIFYKGTPDAESGARIYVSNLFRQNISNLDDIKNKFKSEFYDKSPFNIKFNEIYDSVSSIIDDEYFNVTDPSDSLFSISSDQKLTFSRLVYIKILEDIYDVASRWPRIEWDEYYPDGTPVTLNWELVVNNLARVFIKDLQKESQSVQTSEIGLGIVGG
jgi:hypothetical protein